MARQLKKEPDEDTLMCHALGSNTLTNATRFSHNSIQGHHHSIQGVEGYADKGAFRWSMSVGCLIDPDSPASRYNKGAVHKRPILGTGLILSKKGNTLVISDLHLPYQHIDAFDFLYALKKKYKPKRILNVGDLYDHHRGSYHESEPDALGEDEEYYAAKEAAHKLQKMFPKMIISSGNHDNIPKRKLKTSGLPAVFLEDYNEMYKTKNGWEWVDQYWFNSWDGYPVVVPMRLNNKGRWDKTLP